MKHATTHSAEPALSQPVGVTRITPSRIVKLTDVNWSPRHGPEIHVPVSIVNWAPWVAQISMNLLRDEELVKLIAQSGGKWIFMGLESIDPANLKSVANDLIAAQCWPTSVT